MWVSALARATIPSASHPETSDARGPKGKEPARRAGPSSPFLQTRYIFAGGRRTASMT